jgi:hypothetical protein
VLPERIRTNPIAPVMTYQKEIKDKQCPDPWNNKEDSMSIRGCPDIVPKDLWSDKISRKDNTESDRHQNNNGAEKDPSHRGRL